ncbi:hypothetical protein P3W45_000607 [Vairimorpha bombi]|jgi:very-long-chain (3R)-3-hydroxyacyl-CoA dehydratase
MEYIKIYNFSGALLALLAFITSYVYYNTRIKIYLLITALSQSFFLIEILNIKLNKSNARYRPTVIQLFFRLFNIWVVYFYYECATKYFCVVTGSWYFTDCIRYLYYIYRTKYVKILRYNLFIILYPVSITIEIKSMCFLIKKQTGMIKYAFLSILLLYVPSMIFLILHMFKQRKWANKKRIKTL